VKLAKRPHIPAGYDILAGMSDLYWLAKNYKNFRCSVSQSAAEMPNGSHLGMALPV
jgi:hypothetical protein